MIKQWHIKPKEKEPTTKEIEQMYSKIQEEHIMTTINKIEEFDEKGNMITKYELIKEKPFEKTNETAKLMKQSAMQELLNRIEELEKGV